ncbi:IS110 family RNA-guided transposase [Mycolicibacter icosiumassiliensis]|uniref:IS110 family transposase n=1 Tax=Mycolicibacter icosiumassiliensis TaxID=1792835 RepID=UPI000B1A242C|nr:IS110 family transposase [Mycolicibacter icosiumassiliensis]
MMDVVVSRCAGIDIGKAEVVVCLRVPGPGRKRVSEVRTFRAFTGEIERLASWLAEHRVTHVVMEATGQYWKPVWDVLDEHGFELMLVNARHVKIVPGRKTDVADAVWLAELLEHGLLRGSFVPPRVIRELRDLTRYRKRLVQAHTSEGQRIAKILEDAGIKLDSVVSHLMGVSGRAMLRALIAGQRDPDQLAEMARGRLRPKIPMLVEALNGRFGEHHALMIGLALDHFEYLERMTVHLDERIDTLMSEHTAARDRLDTIPGVGKRAAEVIIAEIGADMNVFPTAKHLASWARMCPGNNITGGKRRSGTTGGGNRWLRETLVECAWAASRQRDSYLAAQFWRLARRIGKKKAALAVGHSILAIAWHLLHDNTSYTDLGGDWFVRRIDNNSRRRDRLIGELQGMGYLVSLEQAAS